MQQYTGLPRWVKTMFGDTIFIRTPEGQRFLEVRDIKQGYKLRMVLNLCNGKNRYSFLESNLRRIDNLAEIIGHLLDKRLITELTPDAKDNFNQSRHRSAPAQYQAGRAQNPPPQNSVTEFDGLMSSADPQPEKQNYKKALSLMGESLESCFSDEVLEWSMEAESCENQADFEALVDRFQEIYAKNAGNRKAGAVVEKVRLMAG